MLNTDIKPPMKRAFDSSFHQFSLFSNVSQILQGVIQNRLLFLKKMGDSVILIHVHVS